MVKDGNRMWNEMVKANWMRESSRGSSSGICVPCLLRLSGGPPQMRPASFIDSLTLQIRDGKLRLGGGIVAKVAKARARQGYSLWFSAECKRGLVVSMRSSPKQQNTTRLMDGSLRKLSSQWRRRCGRAREAESHRRRWKWQGRRSR